MNQVSKGLKKRAKEFDVHIWPLKKTKGAHICNKHKYLKNTKAVEKKQHRIRAVKQAKVLYTPHIIQMN